ncbi:ChuX/HutX family heme-like substrate-binding protein [Pseudomonas aeruginosa]|uniref:ChuX/HutX family heme-like substrate-binding protein n=1 Tax=Pseudomonas aeruginosa TaxID=287 RepID=UPI004046CBCC
MSEITHKIVGMIGKAYPFDIADELRIEELSVAFARVGLDAEILEVENVKEFISRLEDLGEVRCITRNDYAISIQVGRYTNQYLYGYKEVDISAEAGLVLNPRDLDVRIFFRDWNYFFYVDESKSGKSLRSLQVFNNRGKAIHKIYFTEKTDGEKWENIVNDYKKKKGDIGGNLILKKEDREVRDYSHVVFNKSISNEWREMREVHDFYLLMRKHRMDRQSLFCSVDKDLAYKVANETLYEVLSLAKKNGVELAVFVSNSGCVQIFTGRVENLTREGQYINILNKKFRLHVKHEDIVNSWVVSKPSDCGYVNSLEVFAADGQQVLQIYGQRDEGSPEQVAWKNILTRFSAI